MEPNTEIHVSATAPLALLPAAIERMVRARRRKKLAIPVAVLACVTEVLLVVYAAFHPHIMNLFMVLALVVGGAGITFYFVFNWQCGGRENEVAQILAFSDLLLSEIYQKAAEWKIGRAQIDRVLFAARQQQ